MVMGPMLANILMGAVSGATGGGKKPGARPSGLFGRPRSRRRRKFSLTAGQKADMIFIATSIGKTAAANYLNLLRR